MPYTTKQVEQILRSVGHWCTGQEKYEVRSDHRGSRVSLYAEQFQTMIGSLARILDEVGLRPGLHLPTGRRAVVPRACEGCRS